MYKWGLLFTSHIVGNGAMKKCGICFQWRNKHFKAYTAAYVTYPMVCCVLYGLDCGIHMTYPMVCCVLCGLHLGIHDLPYGVLCSLCPTPRHTWPTLWCAVFSMPYTMTYMTYPMVCCVLCGLPWHTWPTHGVLCLYGLHYGIHDLPYGVLCTLLHTWPTLWCAVSLCWRGSRKWSPWCSQHRVCVLAPSPPPLPGHLGNRHTIINTENKTNVVFFDPEFDFNELKAQKLRKWLIIHFNSTVCMK